MPRLHTLLASLILAASAIGLIGVIFSYVGPHEGVYSKPLLAELYNAKGEFKLIQEDIDHLNQHLHFLYESRAETLKLFLVVYSSVFILSVINFVLVFFINNPQKTKSA